jgi:hypothetical protein
MPLVHQSEPSAFSGSTNSSRSHASAQATMQLLASGTNTSFQKEYLNEIKISKPLKN